MNKPKIVFAIVAILLGVFFVAYGGIDDSPGAQILGIVVGIVGVVRIFKSSPVHKP